MRYLIIDTDKLNLHPEIAKQIINAYLWQHDYLKVEGQGLMVRDMFPVMSEEEALELFKEVWNAADERCCDEDKIDWEQFKKTL
jgi:hypothetical protein